MTLQLSTPGDGCMKALHLHNQAHSKRNQGQVCLHGKALTFAFCICSMVARLFFTCCCRSMIAPISQWPGAVRMTGGYG